MRLSSTFSVNYLSVLRLHSLHSLTHPYRFFCQCFLLLHSLTKPKYYNVLFRFTSLGIHLCSPAVRLSPSGKCEYLYDPQKLISFCTEGNPFNIFSFYMKKVRWLERPYEYTKLYIISNGSRNLVLSSSCFSSTPPPHPPCSQIRPGSLSTHPVLAASVRVG